MWTSHRSRPAIAGALLACLALLIAVSTTEASSAPRVPQVAIQGGRLQAFFDGQGDPIDANTDQQDLQVWEIPVPGATHVLEVEARAHIAGSELGLCGPGLGDATYLPLLPPEAVEGWFAVAVFRTDPQRVRVHLFDASAQVLRTLESTELGADGFGFYLRPPGADALHTLDVRNPAGRAQALAYENWRTYHESWWLCWEGLSAGEAPDDDYDDAIFFVGWQHGLPVSRTSWGQLKSRFR